MHVTLLHCHPCQCQADHAKKSSWWSGAAFHAVAKRSPIIPHHGRSHQIQGLWCNAVIHHIRTITISCIDQLFMSSWWVYWGLPDTLFLTSPSALSKFRIGQIIFISDWQSMTSASLTCITWGPSAVLRPAGHYWCWLAPAIDPPTAGLWLRVGRREFDGTAGRGLGSALWIEAAAPLTQYGDWVGTTVTTITSSSSSSSRRSRCSSSWCHCSRPRLLLQPKLCCSSLENRPTSTSTANMTTCLHHSLRNTYIQLWWDFTSKIQLDAG